LIADANVKTSGTLRKRRVSISSLDEKFLELYKKNVRSGK